MGQPANVTSLPEPLCQRYLLRVNKEASFLQRTTLIVDAENESFGHFSPLDSVSDDSREAAVRSGSGSNPRRCSTDQPGPSDLLHHDTGDDLGHPVHWEDGEGVPPGADTAVQTILPDSLQELLSNRQQTGVQPTVSAGVPTLHRDRVRQPAKDRLRVSLGI